MGEVKDMLKEFIECPGALVAVLSGEIDQYGAAYLRSKIDVETELSGKKNLVLDLSEVSFMDSAGIGLIIGRAKNLSPIGGRVALAGAEKKLKRILELGGVTRLCPLYPNYRKAVEDMMK